MTTGTAEADSMAQPTSPSRQPATPIRLDVGLRPKNLQRTQHSHEPPSDARTDLGFVKFAGAIHLTIGEAF